MVSLRIKNGFYQTFQNEVVEKELKETNYDRMNDLVAQSWLHLTSSMRFDGPEKFQHRPTEYYVRAVICIRIAQWLAN